MLAIRALGPMQIERGGVPLVPPASRKARAILGYLLLASRPVGRQRLCELFFDVPDDPRASLRWTLTKLRSVIDEAGSARILSSGDSLRFDPVGASVDVLEILKGERSLQESDGLFLEDAELPDRSEFMAWLYAAREELRSSSVQRLRGLLENPAPLDRRLALYRQLAFLEPMDEAANAGVVRSLAQLGRMDEAREAAAGAERMMLRAGHKPPPSLRGALKVAAPELAQERPAARARETGSLQLIDMLPGVAVIPFQNYSHELIPEMLADGFLESTIHMLSRFRMFRVSSMSSVLAFRGKMQDPAALHEATGADFIVGGSIMARGQNVKIRYRVVDAVSGALLSSGDVDRVATSGASMIEEVPEALVFHLIHHLVEQARARAEALPEGGRSPVDHYICGMSHAYLAVKPDYPTALKCFEAAVALLPGYPPAMAGLAHCKALLRLAREEPARSEAVALAHAAIANGPDDATALGLAAWSLVQLAQEVEPALRAVDRAIQVNPLARVAWSVSAWIRAMNGEYETPMAHWEKAEACSPLGASADQMNAGRSLCCFMAGRYEDALLWARRSLERVPSNPGALTAGVAAAAMLNDSETVRSLGRMLLQHYPEAVDSPVIAAVPIVVPEKRAAILEAARRGMEMARA